MGVAQTIVSVHAVFVAPRIDRIVCARGDSLAGGDRSLGGARRTDNLVCARGVRCPAHRQDCLCYVVFVSATGNPTSGQEA